MNVTALKQLPSTKEEIVAKIGKVANFDIFNTQVLVAKHIRPSVTKGGIHVPETVRNEDQFQGKVGLVVALGHRAFLNDDGELDAKWFPEDARIKLHDYVVYRASDGLDMKVNGVDCKLLKDTSIRGKVSDPDMIW